VDDPFSEYVDQKLVALLKPDAKTRANILVADDLRATLKILLRGYSVPYPVICSDPDEGILVRWSNDGCELELSFWAEQGWRELCFTDKETGENILIGSKASDPEGEKNALTVFSSLIHRLND
jgi:hypothetical protein